MVTSCVRSHAKRLAMGFDINSIPIDALFVINIQPFDAVLFPGSIRCCGMQTVPLQPEFILGSI
jgi:hypothetical protein